MVTQPRPPAGHVFGHSRLRRRSCVLACPGLDRLGLTEPSMDTWCVSRARFSGAPPCPSAVVLDPFGRPSVASSALPLQRTWPKPAAPLAYRRAAFSPWHSGCLPTGTTRLSSSAHVWIVGDTRTPFVNGNVQQPSVSRVSTGSRVNAPPTARRASAATFSVTIAAEWSGAHRLAGARAAEGPHYVTF